MEGNGPRRPTEAFLLSRLCALRYIFRILSNARDVFASLVSGA